MKKTFISPVAEVLSTEAQQVIAASSFKNSGNISAQGSGSENKIVGDARNGALAVNVDALDF